MYDDMGPPLSPHCRLFVVSYFTHCVPGKFFTGDYLVVRILNGFQCVVCAGPVLIVLLVNEVNDVVVAVSVVGVIVVRMRH